MSEEHKCDGNCSTCAHREEEEQQNCQIHKALEHVKNKIVVMSGKGGVGKSSVAVNLALGLALEGMKVGLLDIDIHGPSVPKMLGLDGESLMTTGDKLLPFPLGSLKVISIGFLLETESTAIVWRGAKKAAVIAQFLTDVEWGELDYLIIDAPPGTGDEPLSICQLLPAPTGAVIVTTPQSVAALDVSKSLSFCELLKFPVLGLVENMSGFVCPHCGTVTDIFSSGAGERLAQQFHVPLLAKVPLDAQLCQSGDNGKPVIANQPNSPTGKAFQQLVTAVLNATTSAD